MDVDQVFQPQFSLDSPYLGDYFGVWSVYEAPFRAMVSRVNGTNLHVHMQQVKVEQNVDRDKRRMFNITDDGVAIFEARGPMMKFVPSMGEGASYVRLRQQINSARRDSDVVGGILIGDTPGGTVKGNEDLAADVAKFAAEKPLYYQIEDMTASAGVSIASQATKRYANNQTALYGAMGTYAVIEDYSGAADNLGVKVHVIKAGEFKGAGTPGTEVTEEQLEEVQRLVNALNENYLGLISSGLNRSVDSIRPLADGRVIFASDAVSAGLIDGVQSLEETKQELLDAVSSKTTVRVNRSNTMSDSPATLKELKQAFPNSTAEWRETQLEAEATLSQAAISYAQHVDAERAAEKDRHAKELEEAKAKNNLAQPSSSLGHQPLTEMSVGGDEMLESGEPIQDFEMAVRQRLPKGRQPSFEDRQRAVQYVARTNPQLHRAYIEQTNADKGSKVQRLVREKYEDASA